MSVSPQIVVSSSRSAQRDVWASVTGSTRPAVFRSSWASSIASKRSPLLISCNPFKMRLPRLWPLTPLCSTAPSTSSDCSKRCINTSRQSAPLRANATSDWRKSPNGTCRRNSSINLRELPPLSDIVTIALILNEYFFIWERTENVPEPPPIVTTRRPVSRSPSRWGPGTILLLWLIAGWSFTRYILLKYNNYTILFYCQKCNTNAGGKSGDFSRTAY